MAAPDLSDDANDSLSASRLLWLAMRQMVLDGNPDFPLPYFLGFSHALSLCAVISQVEFSGAQSAAFALGSCQAAS